MVEYDIPAMIHVSTSCNACFHTTGAHYLNADTTAFMQCLTSDLFKDFPTLRFVIPHGGGAVPYHWGRFRGLAQELKKPLLKDHLLNNIFFDTCVYHQPGIDLLTKVIPVDNILFASEMIGAVRGIDPETGHYYDDTKRYIEASTHPDAERQAQDLRRQRAARLSAARCRAEGQGPVSMSHACTSSASSSATSCAPTRAAVDKLSRVRRRHRARGDGPRRPDEALHAADLRRRACRGTAVTVLLQPGDNWMMHVAAEQMQPGDVVVAACTADSTDGFFGDLLATSFQARGARGPGHRRRRARREGPDRDGLPGVEQGHQRQGHDQGHAGLGEHPRGLRRRAGQPGRRGRRRRRRRGRACPRALAQQTADAAAAREANEAEKRAKLAAGVLGLDMYKMREPLEKAGLKYID